MRKGRLLALVLLCTLNAFAWSNDGDAMAGLASWYGEDFHGKMTANGEIYDMTDFTAAHRTLPFGTKVKVVNLLNNKAIIVRVNDRGPFKDERILDVSKAAAEELDFLKNGIIPVRLEVLVQGDEGALPAEETVVNVSDSSAPSALDNVTSSSVRGQGTNSPAPVASTPPSAPISSTEPNAVASNANAGSSLPAMPAGEVSSSASSPIRDIVYVQVGSYRDKTNAIRTARVLADSGFEIQVRENNGYFRVFFEQDPKKVNDSLRLLQNQGYKDPLVRRTMVDGEEIDWKQDSSLASV